MVLSVYGVWEATKQLVEVNTYVFDDEYSPEDIETLASFCIALGVDFSVDTNEKGSKTLKIKESDKDLFKFLDKSFFEPLFDKDVVILDHSNPSVKNAVILLATDLKCPFTYEEDTKEFRIYC